jgi:predicted phosphoribosyltransferase
MVGPIVFKNRLEAAKQLSESLKDFRGHRPLVLGVPRGAVPMAALIARELGGDLDIVLVHKVGHPDHPEFAVGSVTEEGDVLLGEGARRLGMSEQDLEEQALAEIRELRRRRNLFTPGRGAIAVQGRVVIIVDDGIATGATMTAAVRSLKEKQAARIIVATPVATAEAVERLRLEGAEVRVLSLPRVFYAVSQFYDEFAQVEDDEVVEVLNRTRGGDQPSMTF